ncbi:MAG: hypothetical protein QOI06_1486 [Nocardioidaceae bacterium]|nr:hypothetical protein [Nocardioidaceae bacterium]
MTEPMRLDLPDDDSDFTWRVEVGDRLRDPAEPAVYTVQPAPFAGRCEWLEKPCGEPAELAMFGGSTMTLACRNCVEEDKRAGTLIAVDDGGGE